MDLAFTHRSGCARQVGQGLASSLAHVAVALRLWAREGISGLSAHLGNVIGVRAMALAGLIAQLRAVCPEARPLPVFAAAELLADNGADAVSDLVGVTLADFRGAAALSCDAREVVRAAIAAAQRGGAPAALGRGSAGASPAPAPSPGIAPRSACAFRVRRGPPLSAVAGPTSRRGRPRANPSRHPPRCAREIAACRSRR